MKKYDIDFWIGFPYRKQYRLLDWTLNVHTQQTFS